MDPDPIRAAAPGPWWEKLVVSLEFADLSDSATRERLDSVAARANSQGMATAAGWHYGRALPMLTAAIEIWARLGRPAGEAVARNARGSVLRRLGDYDAAGEDHRIALALSREHDLSGSVVTACVGLGMVCLERGDRSGAAQWLGEAERLSAEASDKRGAAQTWYVWGLWHETEKDWDGALRAYGLAVERWRALGAQAEAIEATAGVVRVMLAQGQTVAAYALVEEVLQHLRDRGPTRLDEPLRVYWTIYRTLHVTRQPDAARQFLEMAYTQLRRQAADLTPEQQQLFWEGVSVNRAIVAAWQQGQQSGG
jgi:tetratricopeptide (TPR) repeat protein